MSSPESRIIHILQKDNPPPGLTQDQERLLQQVLNPESDEEFYLKVEDLFNIPYPTINNE